MRECIPISVQPVCLYGHIPKQTVIYKLKMETRNIEVFISTTNNTLHGYLQVKSSNFKYPDSGKMFQERLKKIINNKAKTMPES